MSQFQPTTQHVSNRPLGRIYEPDRVATPGGSFPRSVSSAVVTAAQLDFSNSPYSSAIANESQLSEEELLLLREKETLTKAVEALRIRRQAVAAARRKTEEEVQRLTQKTATPTAETQLREEAPRLLSRHEETESQPARQELRQSGIAAEAACEPAPSRIRQSEEVKTPMRLHERLRELALQERLRTEQEVGGAVTDRLRIGEPPSRRNEAIVGTQEQTSLEQRLRADIEGMAAIQRRNVDAARAQVNLLRNSNSGNASTAA